MRGLGSVLLRMSTWNHLSCSRLAQLVYRILRYSQLSIDNKLLNFTFKTKIAILNSELAEKFHCIKRGHSLPLKDCPRPMTAIQCRCEQFQGKHGYSGPFKVYCWLLLFHSAAQNQFLILRTLHLLIWTQLDVLERQKCDCIHIRFIQIIVEHAFLRCF